MSIKNSERVCDDPLVKELNINFIKFVMESYDEKMTIYSTVN